MANQYVGKPVPTRANLVGLYEKDMRPQREVARILGVSQITVRRWLMEHGIRIRGPEEAESIRVHPTGPQVHNWSSTPNYETCHARVRAIRGTPNLCEFCGLTDPDAWFEWASMSKKYDDPNDYKRLCVPCHRKHDAAGRSPPDKCYRGHQMSGHNLMIVNRSDGTKPRVCRECKNGRRRKATESCPKWERKSPLG